jgi:hypothetical protein
MTRRRRPAATSQVLLAAVLAVAAVLGVQLLGILVPPLDAALATAPVVVGILVVGTLLVLVTALRPRPPSG